MKIIPAVDVLDGRVVRLLRGDFEAVTKYGADPCAAVAGWVADGGTLVHVVDLEGALSGESDWDLWRSLGAAGLPFQAGGGLRTMADAVKAIAVGALRVVIGTTAVWDADVLGAIASAVSTDRVVAALDVRDGRAVGSGWREEGKPLEEVLETLAVAGIIRALVTSIPRDGTLEGPDLTVLGRVSAASPGLALIASGGIGSLDDVRDLAAMGAEAAIVGRALYEGRFTLAQARDAAA